MPRLLPLIALASTLSCYGATLITATGSSTGASAISSSQMNAVSWTLSDAWTNVSIGASLFSLFPETTGIAYLNDVILSTQIATTVFNFVDLGNSNSALPFVDLFANLTLGPGTYQLIFVSNSPSAGYINLGAIYNTATGVTIGTPQLGIPANLANFVSAAAPVGAYVDAPSGHRFVNVAGDLVTPEPSTILLLGGGLFALALRRLR